MSSQPQVNGSQVLYTVEQIELIRRLRNSGINKEQLVQAFESLDRMDRELGTVYNIPNNQAAQLAQVMLNQQAQQAYQRLQNAISVQNALVATTAAQQAQAIRSHMITSPTQQPPSSQQSPLPQTPAAPSTPQPPSITPSQNNESRKRSAETAELNSVMNGHHTMTEEPEDLAELNDFIAQGEQACCEEIKAFVLKYNIKQQQVAVLSAISQSYVSRYLKGDYFDMSEKSRRSIQKWYLLYRKNPAAIGPAVNAVLLNNSPLSKRLIMSPELTNSEFVCYPKRERFVFRPCHLEILESHFQEDSYPSHEMRDEIAKMCNAGTEGIVQRPLTDRERVTAQIVSNWFANKRKELKKIAREEGLDVSQVAVRPRGRSIRVLSDINQSLMGQPHLMGQSPPDLKPYTPAQLLSLAQDPKALLHGHLHEQLQEMKSIGQYPEKNGSRDIKLYAPVHGKTGPHYPDKSPSQLDDDADDEEPLALTTNGNSGVQSPENDDSIPSRDPSESHSDEQVNTATDLQEHSSGEVADERALSLSVELAAVNQAILSLTGQQPISVKMEKQDQNHKPREAS